MRVNVSRRYHHVACLVIFGMFATVSMAPAADSVRRPNVLIITTDQQSVDAMSALGNKWVKTPSLDSLAAKGVSFRRSYTSCKPTRAR